VLAHGHHGAVLRITPWHGGPHAVQVVPVAGPGPTTDEVVDVVSDLGRRGISTVVTAALAAIDQAAFRSAGFDDHEHLLLLHRPLTGGDRAVPDPRRDGRLRRSTSGTAPVRPGDRETVLALDRQAFTHASPTWQVDHEAMVDAAGATDDHRWRLVRRSPATTGPAGHALTGRTGTTGFLQRLAVHPAAQRRGVGSRLVVDALRWLVRSGARDAFVNTQPGNAAARSLYERHGFSIRPDGLDVLRLDLGQAGLGGTP